MRLAYSFKITNGGFVKFMLGTESRVISREHTNVKDVGLTVAIKEKCFLIDAKN